MTEFYIYIGLAAIIIQILIIYKFFQIASDIREISNQIKSQRISPAEMYSEDDEIKGKVRGVEYTVIGNNVTFSDGKSGKIHKYVGFKECSVINDNNIEFLYNDVHYAVNGLYQYITTNNNSYNGLIKKRQFKGEL